MRYFCDQCLARVATAAADLASKSFADLEDMDEGDQSPEQLMLGIVSADGAKERLKRANLLPWVRFAWDSMKNVLEALKMSRNAENVYHYTAQRCFVFLVEYERRTEMHRLCETLRRHLNNLMRNSSSEPLTEATIEAHLRTRFAQLSHCTALKQWNEAFHTLEDMHELIEATQHTPKVHMLAAYYQDLARVLWQNPDTHLYHAHAWYSFYSLSVQCNTSLTADQRKDLATVALLSALVIPHSARATDEGYNIELEMDKKERVARLLRFMPTEACVSLCRCVSLRLCLRLDSGPLC